MEPGTQKEIIIDHGDGLCSRRTSSTVDVLALRHPLQMGRW
jgi:hypothetical protein